MRENTIRKIVVGTDFHELAAAALRFSGGIAARAGAELVVVDADLFEPPPEFTAAQVKHIAEVIERSKSKTREQLEQHIRENVPDGVAWRAIVADGFPASAKRDDRRPRACRLHRRRYTRTRWSAASVDGIGCGDHTLLEVSTPGQEKALATTANVIRHARTPCSS